MTGISAMLLYIGLFVVAAMISIKWYTRHGDHHVRQIH